MSSDPAVIIRLTHDGTTWHATCDQDPAVHGWSVYRQPAVAEVRRQLGDPHTWDIVTTPTAPCAHPGCAASDEEDGRA